MAGLAASAEAARAAAVMPIQTQRRRRGLEPSVVPKGKVDCVRQENCLNHLKPVTIDSCATWWMSDAEGVVRAARTVITQSVSHGISGLEPWGSH